MSSCRPKHQKRTTENAARGQSSSSTLAVPSRKPYGRPRPRSAPNLQGGPAIDIEPCSSRPVHQSAHDTTGGCTGSTLVSMSTSTDSTFLDVPRDTRCDRPRSTPTTSGPYYVPYSSTRASPEARAGPSSDSLPNSRLPSHYTGHQYASRTVTPLPTPHVRVGRSGSSDPSGWPEPLPHGPPPDIFAPIPGHSTSPLYFYQPSDPSLPGPSQSYHVQSSSSGPAPPPLATSDGEPYYDPRNSHRSAPFPRRPPHVLHYMSTSNGDPSIPHQYRHAQHLQQAPSDYLYHNQPSVAYHPRSVTRADHTSRPFPQQTPSFFPYSHNFHLENFSYHEAPQRGASTLDWERGWDDLVKLTSPNALYDAEARFDAPKCDEGTRLEVIEEVMNWITDREAPTRLLCMTGAAGAGKSALQQTIAERCLSMGILASAFFFYTADKTRNSLTGVIPTMAYQLGLKHPTLRRLIGDAAIHDPKIFKKSVFAQVTALVAEPVKAFLAKHADGDARNFPYAMLIDGLDECQGPVAKDQTKDQTKLLNAIKKIFLDEDTPFRIFIASRPEWAIRNALEGPLAGLAYHIALSDKYDASADIRRFLIKKLHEIGLRSGDPRAQPPGAWPTEEDIAAIVKAASGQFIYATTVVKYISERPSSPVDRLRVVLTWKPAPGQRAAPFAMLDVLYTNILSPAKAAYAKIDTNEPEDFLFLLLCYQGIGWRNPLSNDLGVVDLILGYPEKTHKLVLSDLRSVLYCDEESGRLQHYHKSLKDFLESELRAKELYVTTKRLYTFVLHKVLENISRQDPITGRHMPMLIDAFENVVSHFLGNYGYGLQTNEDVTAAFSLLAEFTRSGGWSKLNAYQHHQGSPGGKSFEGSQEELELRLLNLSNALGGILFDIIAPKCKDMESSSVAEEVSTAVQRWQYTTLAAILSRLRELPTCKKFPELEEALPEPALPYDPTWRQVMYQKARFVAVRTLRWLSGIGTG